MRSGHPILIVNGEPSHRSELAGEVWKSGMRPVCCSNVATAKALLARAEFSLVLCEDHLPDGTFRTLLQESPRTQNRLPLVVISGRNDWNSYLQSLSAGAFDCVSYPLGLGQGEPIMFAALNAHRDLSDRSHHPAPFPIKRFGGQPGLM